MDNDEQRDYAEEAYNARLLTEEDCDCEDHTECEWCNDSDNDEPDTDNLCRAHLAEYEGLSVDELDRMEDEQARELM